ncbi:archaetidylserine decarboxylase [Candidatus Nitrosacidococcus tergens]|uniref:Phosphatidylserine decarboxylase proenzyme n=1 Tax=Candidatus Nitrosacidococcus tergens TaxID=553981 RepID=A0A7G1Q7L9_9GAMM|nr:Phosphatidylserine decarboxylase proenzyme [Candidatus Nitrosacidococcus tergens]
MANNASHRLRDWLLSLYQYLLPQHILSLLIYHFTRHKIHWLTQLEIHLFRIIFRVNMDEAKIPYSKEYPNFNTFFSRALRESVRPIAKYREIACPVDGHISQIGTLSNRKLIQAKGWHYQLTDLLGHPQISLDSFYQGSFATFYLHPRDYHRVHMPLDGHLKEMIYIPGRLFSVSPKTVNGVPQLFSHNERVINIFNTEIGPMIMVLVGAIFVGSIETVWAGQITPPYQGYLRHWVYTKENKIPKLSKGQEMGRFNMGSTVILIFPTRSVEWLSHLAPNARVLMGQNIGAIR